MDKNRGVDRTEAAAGTDRRGRKVPSKPDKPSARAAKPGAISAGHRSRRPAVLGVLVTASAAAAWLLRRERPRPAEGTWRDALSSDAAHRSRIGTDDR